MLAPEPGSGMRRREFSWCAWRRGGDVAGGGAGEQRERMRRVGVLMNLGSDDAEGQARNAASLQGLHPCMAGSG
jgi:hypothetical protein